MSTPVRCFWIEPAGIAVESLRRFCSKPERSRCAGVYGFHNASVDIGNVPWTEVFYGRYDTANDRLKQDSRWPKKCDACGYFFASDDDWQHGFDQKFRRVDTGETFQIRRAPPGAMWDATWWPGKGPDGRALTVMLPDGNEWLIDDGRWRRKGEPPRITVSPSIRTPRYHGHLIDGMLVPC
jgi:hypothetical protein